MALEDHGCGIVDSMWQFLNLIFISVITWQVTTNEAKKLVQLVIYLFMCVYMFVWISKTI